MNYTELKANIQNFLEDDSTELSDSLDVIIEQGEAMIFKRAPNLPCYRSSATGSLVVGQTNYTIATARMIRQVSITSSSDTVYLNHRVDSYLNDYWKNSTTQAQPEMYSTQSASTTGTVIKLAPTPDSTYAYAVDYIAPETGLSSGNTTTWVGNNASNALLNACLTEASAFLKAPETVSLYQKQFEEAIALLQEEMKRDYAAEYNGGI